jgi:SAM-dependent methyltransferase
MRHAERRSRRPLARARRYVATSEESGLLQLELLRKEGCLPSSSVLEVGCGCLNAGVPVMRYLDPVNYVGIEPNQWLLDAAMTRRSTRRLIADRQPTFLRGTDFDATELGRTFDYVLSHSVLSHCAHHQLDQFVGNVERVLATEGRIVASVRLAEGNAYGSTGTADCRDSMHEEWQYQDVSWFSLSTVAEAASRRGLIVIYKPEYTGFFVSQGLGDVHDWLVFTRPGSASRP